MPGHVLLCQNCPFPWGSEPLSNTWFIRFTQLSGFAGLTAVRPYTLQWAAPFPLQIAPLRKAI